MARPIARPSRHSAALTRRALCAGAGAALLLPSAARAGAVHISVAEFPNDWTTPGLIAAMKIAFGKLPGTTVEVTTAAFSRSIGMVVAGDADLHLPIIRPPNEDAADYAFSTATIARTMFILYTNKDKPLDRANLGHYAIETEANHVGCFEFPVQPGAGFEASLQKLAAGRIDGFIFGGATIDPILDRLKLTAIHREPYKLFDIAAVIAKGTKGGPIDDLLTRAIKAAADDPAYQAETRKMLIGYRGPDWQVS